MNMFIKMRIVLLLVALAALTACGNKGPLVMPTPKPVDAPAAEAPAQPAATEPATPEPATPEPAASESGTPTP